VAKLIGNHPAFIFDQNYLVDPNSVSLPLPSEYNEVLMNKAITRMKEVSDRRNIETKNREMRLAEGNSRLTRLMDEKRNEYKMKNSLVNGNISNIS
jgi:hypothetical protein